MKCLWYSFFALSMLFFSVSSAAQETRYFQFRTFCGGDNWQDTSFVAAATNEDLINMVLSEIERPFDQRKFIIGDIAEGDGGHNFNGDFRFNWHFVPDEWLLTEVAVEVCDGCPFSNVHQEPDLWQNNVGFFCPWSSKPVREITLTSVDGGGDVSGVTIQVFPNPARQRAFIKHNFTRPVQLELVNVVNQQIQFRPELSNGQIDLSAYPAGVYALLIRSEGNLYTRKLVIQ